VKHPFFFLGTPAVGGLGVRCFGLFPLCQTRARAEMAATLACPAVLFFFLLAGALFFSRRPFPLFSYSLFLTHGRFELSPVSGRCFDWPTRGDLAGLPTAATPCFSITSEFENPGGPQFWECSVLDLFFTSFRDRSGKVTLLVSVFGWQIL